MTYYTEKKKGDQAMVKLFKAIFGGKKTENQWHQLNSICDKTFKDIFSRCRHDFSHELLELMDIRKGIYEQVSSKEGYSSIQEMIAKKLFELILAYFELADTYVSMNQSDKKDPALLEKVASSQERLERIHTLVGSLNTQFYIKSKEVKQEDLLSYENDLVDEAEALCNVLREDVMKKSI